MADREGVQGGYRRAIDGVMPCDTERAVDPALLSLLPFTPSLLRSLSHPGPVTLSLNLSLSLSLLVSRYIQARPSSA